MKVVVLMPFLILLSLSFLSFVNISPNKLGLTVEVDWEADRGNKLTFPIGLGITKTIRMGKASVKSNFGAQYSVIRPDNFRTAWNFWLQISPIVPSPFK